MLRRFALAYIVVFFAAFPLAAKDLEVGVYPFAPYFSISPSGQMGGVWKDLLEKELTRLGYHFTFAAYPPPRLARNIIEGRTDLTISAHHIAVDGHVHYSERPVTDIILDVYHKPDRPMIRKIADLKNKSVIVIRGYAYNGQIKQLLDLANGITLIESVTHVEAVRRLLNGYADYLLDYRYPIKNAFRQANITGQEFVQSELSRYSVYFVISKKTRGGAQLARKLNESLKD